MRRFYDKRAALAAATALTIAAHGPALAGSYIYRTVPGAGYSSVLATGILGTFVVGQVDSAAGKQGAVWYSNNGPHGVKDKLVAIPGTLGFIGITSDSLAIDGAASRSGYLTYKIAGGKQKVSKHKLHSRYMLTPAAVSPNGIVAGYAMVGQHSQGFVVSGSAPVLLLPPGSRDSTVLSVNDSGEAVGYYTKNGDGEQHSFSYNNGVYTEFDPPKYQSSRAYYVEDSSNIYVQVDDSAFVLSNGSYTQLKVPGASVTTVTGIVSVTGESGAPVGYYADSSGSLHGFVRVNGTYYTINVPDSTQTSIMGVNTNGEIFGNYVSSAGTPLAFVAGCPFEREPCTK